MNRRFLLLSVILVCSLPGAMRAAFDAALSFKVVEGAPVVFAKAKAGNLDVALRGIAYDAFGRVASYEMTIAGDGSQVSVTVQSRQNPDKSVNYVVTVDGRPVAAADESGLGFSPVRPGGLVVAGSVELVTNLAYDEFGRQQISKQTATVGGYRVEVSFAGFQYDSAGRLTGYRAHVERTPSPS